MYDVEWTDTFGGEANYCWVKRLRVKANSHKHAMQIARKEWGISGTRGRFCENGDQADWRPYRICWVIFSTWAEEGKCD
jgi:hypothetical protein